MSSTYERILKDNLNKKAKDILAFFDEYNKEGTSVICKEAIITAVKTLNTDAAVMLEQNNVTREQLEIWMSNTKSFLKTQREVCEAFVEFVVNEMDADSKKILVLPGSNNTTVIARKKVGISGTGAIKLFGVSEKKVNELFKNYTTNYLGLGTYTKSKDLACFISVYVDTFVRNAVSTYLTGCSKKLKNVKYTLSPVYKVENRNIFDIDVDFVLKLEDVSENHIADLVEAVQGIPLFGLE